MSPKKRPAAKKPAKAARKARPKRRLLGRVRGAASAFLSSEEGKILKKDIIKTAISLGLMAAAAGNAEAQHTDAPAHTSSHSDVAHSDAAHQDYVSHRLHNDGAASYHDSGSHADAAHSDMAHSDVLVDHSNHVNTHANHSNHSNHSSGGWC